MNMSPQQLALCENHDFDFSGLSALYLNCTLKPSGTQSHTESLISVSAAIMEANDVTCARRNLMHMARLLREAGGIPAHGNQRSEWDAGCRSDHPNPDYR